MIIRKMMESDLMSLYEILSDPDAMKYIEEPYTLEKTKQFLRSAGLAESPLIYAVENDEGIFAGYVIFHDYDENTMELGWILNKEFWGKGYASILTKELMEKAKQAGKDSVIECDPRQTITKHIAEKNGFKYWGENGGCDIYRYRSH